MTETDDLQLNLQRLNTVEKKMNMCEKDDRLLHQERFLIGSKRVSLSLYILASRKAFTCCKMFITQYIPIVRFIISKHNTLLTTSIWIKSFSNYFAPKMIRLNILQNVVIYLLKYFVLDIITYTSTQQDKSKFLLFHNFKKFFSGTRLNETVNKCLNG